MIHDPRGGQDGNKGGFFVPGHFNRRSRRREDEHYQTVHGRRIHSHDHSDYDRSGLLLQDPAGRKLFGETADLGYGRTRAVSNYNPELDLLPQFRHGHSGVRRYLCWKLLKSTGVGTSG